MNAIVQTNLVNSAAAAAPADSHQQTKAEDAKRLSAAEIMNKGAVASPAQMMHAMAQVNAGGAHEASGAGRSGHYDAPKPTTDMKQMNAAARPLPKPQAAPAKDHEAMTQDALAVLRAIPSNPEGRRVHTTHSVSAAPGKGSSSSAQDSAGMDQITQVVGNMSLSALADGQGADRHDDED